MTNAQAPCSHSTATTKGGFTPLTPEIEIEKAGGPSTTEYDRGFSDTSDGEGSGDDRRERRPAERATRYYAACYV
jgi:hypothetical protein